MFAGLLPLLLFAVFAGAAFVNETDDAPDETDPDDNGLGSGSDATGDMGGDVGGDTGGDSGGGDETPPDDDGSAALPEIIDEEDGEDEVIMLELSAAALAALATDATAPEEDGFTAFLDGGDQLTLSLSDDVEGRVLVLSTEYRTEGEGDDPDRSRFALTLYILPDDTDLPDDLDGVSEAQLIEDFDLTRFGEVDLGQLVSETDPDTGEITILEDTRQTEVPLVVANRAIVSGPATFI